MLDTCENCPEPWRRSLTSMQEQAARMRRLVDDLLLLSRLETDDEPASMDDPVSVPAVIAAVEEDAGLRSDGRHRIQVEADGAVWLLGDAEQLRSVFSNLVHNAVHYTPEDGEITVRWYADDDGAHFQVTDNGIGIATQHIERLTERFYRVDVGRSREQGGTGLGLAIVKHVLNRHEGALDIESRLGEGSTFTCHFPTARVLNRAPDLQQAMQPAAATSAGADAPRVTANMDAVHTSPHRTAAAGDPPTAFASLTGDSES
jgi:two-component system phosphate regulon sensor histidine kinase PhoR